MDMGTILLIVWLAAAIIFAVVEIVTVQLVAVWFSIGSVVAMAACSAGAPIWVQLMIFGVVSLILLLLTRPFVRKVLKVRHVRTNADRLIGKTAVATEDIVNLESKGTVVFSGVTWTARSENGEMIAKGKTVLIKAIEGSKLIVSALPEHAGVPDAER